jgi:hypothetical protein
MMSSAGGGQATPPPPPSPPPPSDNTDTDEFDDENEDSVDDVIDAAMNAKFMADAEQEAKEERAAHAEFDAKQQHCREAATVGEESDRDKDDDDWSGPDPEEKVIEKRALFASFEMLKKAQDNANEALQQQLLEDAGSHRAPASAQWMEQRAASEKQRREGNSDGARSSTAPRGDR